MTDRKKTNKTIGRKRKSNEVEVCMLSFPLFSFSLSCRPSLSLTVPVSSRILFSVRTRGTG